MAPVHCFLSITASSVPSSARTCAETRKICATHHFGDIFKIIYSEGRSSTTKVTLVMMLWWWRMSLWRSSSSYPSATSGVMFGASSSLKRSKVSCCFRVNMFFGCISSTTRSAQKKALTFSFVTKIHRAVKLSARMLISTGIYKLLNVFYALKAGHTSYLFIYFYFSFTLVESDAESHNNLMYFYC